MSNLDPKVCECLKSARKRAAATLASLHQANNGMMRVYNSSGHPTEADRDVLFGIHEAISDIASALCTLEWYIDGHAGEVEE